MKKIISFVIVFIINIIFANFAFAENFYIENYDVQINVTQDKTLHITEKIDTLFTHASHGIFRTIPTVNKIERADGTGYTDRALISNIEINDQYKFSQDANGVVKLKIGNPDILVDGKQTYIIKYDYKMMPDESKNFDELYFNIIGTEWPVEINNVNFKITMPQEFEKNKVGLSIGRKGRVGFDSGAIFLTDGKAVKGYTTKKLYPKEGITLRIELPENYFVKPSNVNPLLYKALMILLILIPLLIWFIYGKDEPIVPVVNFYPPDKKNSAEIGVEYRGNSSIKDVVSLIIYLASKGYLKIETDESDFTITKLKDYDGKKPEEKMLMDALFADSDIVEQEDLKYSRTFYIDCENIQRKLNKLKKYIFDAKACSFEKILAILACIICSWLIVIYNAGYNSFVLLSNPTTIFQILFPVIITSIVILIGFFNKNRSPFIYIFLFLWWFGFCGSFLMSFISFDNPIMQDIVLLVLALICTITSIICLIYLPKRNRNGQLALGHILGFKHFIEVAEKHRLEMQIQENPSYFYDILPFAYVLDVSDKWIENFEGIIIPPSNYYSKDIDPRRFRKFTDRMQSLGIPSTSNGGISSSSSSGGGGGCSGGGGGGGGGGSW